MSSSAALTELSSPSGPDRNVEWAGALPVIFTSLMFFPKRSRQFSLSLDCLSNRLKKLATEARKFEMP